MIVRMNEILLFTSEKRSDAAIRRLGELGVVDIKEVQAERTSALVVRSEAVRRAEEAIDLLTAHNGASTSETLSTSYVLDDPQKLVDRVLAANTIRKKLTERLDEFRSQLNWYSVWGEDIRIDDLHYLQERGIYLRFYLITASDLQKIHSDLVFLVIKAVKGKVLLVLVSRNEEIKLPYPEHTPPRMSRISIEQQVQRKERQMAEVGRFLAEQQAHLAMLADYHALLQDRLKMQEAYDGMGTIEGRVKYLKGFIPKDATERFKAVAEKEQWGFQIGTPEDPDEVPVYIKNPKWVSVIDPVMKFIDIVPGYKEIDVSIYFLVAFALFFAMLVGDAGYGAVFLILTILLRKKYSPQLRVLAYVLSAATMIWGMLSGTYFGAEEIAALPFFRQFVIEDIASFGVNNISFMMHLSFLIGAIHLTIAHGIRLFQFINSVKALSEVGWIALVWGLFLLTEQLVLGKSIPAWGIWLFIGGATLVAFFSKESKNFFASMGVSLANLPLSLISGFSDIVSYVRLFAVGMATAAVAASFNNMILPNGFTGMGLIELFMAAIALLLGHGLNIALALMAVMVHGIRLNMLEFAGHLGVQFSGEAYKPFKLESNQNIDKQNK